MSAFAVGLFQNGKKKKKKSLKQTISNVCLSLLTKTWLVDALTANRPPGTGFKLKCNQSKEEEDLSQTSSPDSPRVTGLNRQAAGVRYVNVQTFFFFFFLSSGDHTGGRRQSCYFAVKVLSPKFPLLFDSIRHSHVIEPTQSHGLSVF